MNIYEFRIYIVDATMSSTRAVQELEALLEHRFKNQYSLKVIDVLTEPELAEADKVLATPTVVKVTPPPERRIIGNLSIHEKVLVGLGLV